MSSALFGFVGVIAGVLSSGGVQLFLGWRDRRRDARVAAAIVVADLAVSRLTLAALTKGEPPEETHLERLLESWQEERRALASGVSPAEFHTIAAAFEALERYIVGGRTPTMLGALGLLETLDRGMVVAWRASGMKNAALGTDTAHPAAESP